MGILKNTCIPNAIGVPNHDKSSQVHTDVRGITTNPFPPDNRTDRGHPRGALYSLTLVPWESGSELLTLTVHKCGDNGQSNFTEL